VTVASQSFDAAAYARWRDASWDPRAWSPADDAPREAEPDDAGPLDFSDGEAPPIRFDSQGHWLQSCLKRLVAPELAVDGSPGQRTRLALKEFQRRAGQLAPRSSALVADGVAGPATIAALEAATATWAPDHGGAAAPEQHGPIAVTRLRGPEFTFRVAADGRFVDLRFAALERRDRDGRCVLDPHNLALHTPPPELAALQAIGLLRGEAAVLRATCTTGPGSLDTTGPALVSLGLGFSGRGGGLATLLAALHEDPAASALCERLLAPCGLSVAHGPYTRLDLATGDLVEREGFELTLTDPDAPSLRGDAAWAVLRGQPHRLGALALVAADPAVAHAQALAWRDHVLDRTLRWPLAGPLVLADVFTSELGVAAALLLARAGHLSLRTWFEDQLKILVGRHPGVDLHDPAAWVEPALAAALTDAALAGLTADERGRLAALSRVPGSLRGDPAPASHDIAEARVTGPAAPCSPTGARTPPHGPATAAGYVERRVRVATYGTVAAGSPLLVPVPAASPGPKRLHIVAARALAAMSAEVQRDLGIGLKIASAWRPHRWTSRAQYEAVLVQRFGSIAEGKRWLGFDSPHETGLAIDIGVGGLWPSRSTADAQRRQPLHLWLVEHAARFGWHPYKVEPWHWEHPISLAAYRSGALAPDDNGPPPELLAFSDADDEDDALEDSDLEEALD